MDGVFINLTGEDVTIIDANQKKIIIPGNIDLVTPIKNISSKEQTVNGIVSVPLSQEQINSKIGQWDTNEYNNVYRNEIDVKINSYKISGFIKYTFRQEQKIKIDKITNGRTRLFIMSENEVDFWSSGQFDCPFRNYRIFTVEGEKLIERGIPKTYLDVVVDGVSNIKTFFKT